MAQCPNTCERLHNRAVQHLAMLDETSMMTVCCARGLLRHLIC